MKKPVIHPSAFVADNATVRGSVTLGANSSVFFGAVLRGDRAPITIGAGTNIQDNCVVHVDYDHPVTVGENVTVGHGAILHGCTVGDNTLIGMGAIVLNGAKVGSNCLIGAGALVPQNVEIPDGSLAFGSPASPDHSLKREIFDLLAVEQTTRMRLTENWMISPGEALCGLFFSDARYFSVGQIDAEQLRDYAERRGLAVETVEKIIPNNV